ncbi:hypothetical protein BRADI_4g33975v3 [Brachypodium distachyon]|uniref:Uncharacterized protein n=1 Tax=Brachypodium distachyon TaxID=15368 RepID=A0A0Q3EWN1_BRADI|nr:hypothetical protein BRADI_4g33975v3 [Brachypodium distachyon]
MGSCVSRSQASAGSAAITANVVDIDGSMAQFVAPVTASEALEATASSTQLFFLCSSDELRFEAPPRALAADEPLQPGWRVALLGAAAAHAPPPALRPGDGRARRQGHLRPRPRPHATTEGGSSFAAPRGRGETLGKTRKRAAGYRSRSPRRRAAARAKRLGAILEASDSD